MKVVQQAAQRYSEGAPVEASLALKEYDRTLGGVGVYMSKGGKLPGIYRPLSYVDTLIREGRANEYGRFIVQASCAYLEESLKKLVRARSWIDGADKLPLGSLMTKIRGRLSDSLAKDLERLNSQLYVFAKHHYDFTWDGEQGLPEPDHYFEMDEAMAVYLIARALGLDFGQIEP